ncbi:MAG: glycosyltransferase [Bacteroidota bacterium]|nr:glycosyltransferase [Bacteroidota bacterium]
MKILILPSWYLPEGGEFCKEQAIHLKASGINVNILANVELSWKKYGFRALTFPFGFKTCIEDGMLTNRHYSLRIPKSEKLNVQKWILSTLKQFDVYIKKYGKPDLIHAHSAMWAGYVAHLIKQKYGIPYVITEHRGRFSEMAQPNSNTFKDWYSSYLHKAFSNADFIIPVSDLLIKKIREFSGIDAKIQAISNIVDTDFFHPETFKKGDVFTFFTANSYHDAKGYDVLLKAFDLVRNQASDVKLVIAGEGFNNCDFQTYLSQCKNREFITFTGFLEREEIRNHLWSADSYVLASRIEAQPISVLEALSTGLPVVCTEVVPSEVLIPEAGYRAPVNDAVRLAKAMLEMINNHKSFDNEFIADHARKLSSPQHVINKLLKVYHSILG